MALLVVNDSLAAQLEALIAPGSYLYGAQAALYQSDTEPGPDSALGDFTLADFPGYAPADITWATVAVSADNVAVVRSVDTPTFAPDTGTDQTIYGWLLLTSTGELVGGERFEPPRRVMATKDTISFKVSYSTTSQI